MLLYKSESQSVSWTLTSVSAWLFPCWCQLMVLILSYNICLVVCSATSNSLHSLLAPVAVTVWTMMIPALRIPLLVILLVKWWNVTSMGILQVSNFELAILLALYSLVWSLWEKVQEKKNIWANSGWMGMLSLGTMHAYLVLTGCATDQKHVLFSLESHHSWRQLK